MSRIIKEYNHIRKLNALPDNMTTLHPVSNATSDLSNWHSIILGPKDSPYHNKSFLLEIHIPTEYPSIPPVIKFNKNSIPPHCNVNFTTGEICLNILKNENWSPVWNLLYSVQAIIQLLAYPDPSSPLNIDLSRLLTLKDSKAYNSLIKYYLYNFPKPELICDCEI
ncbi:hypothetical protein TBLA_0C04500 [Henningerozyma blattae CBS 6284]|uniref:UBC core domain-containing protein n=1 Tax=Henningerozyma blattae (strain ATCC 34711 / CBS 6284 / DSM 70876 / NBRC 10599 / NRRL Y-10934 / UCD 77-7) TaxID=1071380 RepID=I2H1J5_HENB6|nr:hypothetical protein TBLA_0C04500 [Tetrapisispora blattae CBS 6284]CCH60247.1 hypothetical protein TBLA_0C04500 [Tetrapisispora blattae CBS 6284]